MQPPRLPLGKNTTLNVSMIISTLGLIVVFASSR